ncbi:hypothetical protein SGRA_0540 [Saprospira grandis str. Lewin]|uniref:Uncharacterized protein n=1 Tax=Saprospira grandis (strain Lewin) TaxID=984262 RepID=H6KYZ5_SAPGL|nr:hypothetical protein SGRA_0540 [Saprospira grandis str. Lewin]
MKRWVFWFLFKFFLRSWGQNRVGLRGIGPGAGAARPRPSDVKGGGAAADQGL